MESSTRTADAAVLTSALLLRLVVFGVAQAGVALVLAGAGTADAWTASSAWWPVSMTIGSVVSLFFLLWRGRVEGFRYRELLRPVRDGWPTDLLWAVVVVAVGSALAVAGQFGLALAIFGDVAAPNALLAQPLPVWAAIAVIAVFPASVALTELPLYLGYLQPRLTTRTGSATLAVILPALLLSLQHATAPLLLDPPFLLWRGTMFLGFAVALAIGTLRRPRILPYLVVAHFALDLQAAIMILLASIPAS